MTWAMVGVTTACVIRPWVRSCLAMHASASSAVEVGRSNSREGFTTVDIFNFGAPTGDEDCGRPQVGGVEPHGFRHPTYESCNMSLLEGEEPLGMKCIRKAGIGNRQKFPYRCGPRCPCQFCLVDSEAVEESAKCRCGSGPRSAEERVLL